MSRPGWIFVCLLGGLCAAAVAASRCTAPGQLARTGTTKRGHSVSTRADELAREYQGALVAAAASFASLPERVRVAAHEAATPRAAASRPAAPAPPLSLTASDGSGLQLVSLRARAVVEGPLAFTELALTFRNPQPRQLEGRFSITLPDEAAISRFAMKIDGKWQEAEVVERQAAQEMYEEFLHRRQDPALLEKKAGNEFSARIFPIPASGEKEIMLSYSQELRAATAPYRLPLRGLPRMQRLEVSALIAQSRAAAPASSLGGALVSRHTVQLERSDYAPDQDFEVPLPQAAAGLQHDNLVVARVRPDVPEATRPVGSLLLLFDTSASRAAGFAAQVEGLGALVRALVAAEGAALPLEVVCFDQTVESVYAGAAGGFGEAELERIRARHALGASNLHGALGWAAGRPGRRRVLLATDGVATAGPTDGASLRQAVARLAPATERLDVLLVGGIRDEALMGRLARGSLREDGAVLDGELPSSELARRLRQRTLSGVEVEIAGARWVWPSALDGVQPGHEQLIYADLPRGARAAHGGVLALRLSGPLRQTLRVPLATAERPLLERAWVKAQLGRLAARLDTLPPGGRPAAQREMVDLSTRHRVLCDLTALLVLETEEDYRRFNLARRALADILAVGPAGLRVLKRTSAVRPSATPQPALQLVRKGEQPAPSWLSRRPRSGPLRARSRGSHVASIFGRDTPLGADAEDALGGLIGNQIGEAYGVGGLGSVGAGRGARHRRGLYGLRGPRNNPDPHLARRIAEGAAQESGVLGILRAGAGRSASASASEVVATRMTVRGGIDRELVRRVVRQHVNEVRYCHQRELQAAPNLAGRVEIQFTIAATGQVVASVVQGSTLGSTAVESCLAQAVRRWQFPRPRGGGIAIVSYPFVLRAAGGAMSPERASAPPPTPPTAPSAPAFAAPHAGRMARVSELVRGKQLEEALIEALRWRREDAGDTLALIALGEALAARGSLDLAARAYGSLIDLYPSRADMRRYAGARLEALGAAGLPLAVDTYSAALAQRPDHLSGYRLLAYALLREGKPERAFETLERGLVRPVPEGRFAGVDRVLREDLGLVAAAWQRARPGERRSIAERLRRRGAALATRPSLRFVMSWETDANDVDLHVFDGHGGHAYYRQPKLPSGGALYEDVMTGYGPECFAIEGKPRGYPYRLLVHYYAQGPMGYGMGKVEIVEHDGEGGLRFRQRPFVVLTDDAHLHLGTVAGPLGG